MKKIFDEKFGLAVNVFSALAVVVLLLCAYLFRLAGGHAGKHVIEKEKFHLELQKF
jgi:hypothetical protein